MHALWSTCRCDLVMTASAFQTLSFPVADIANKLQRMGCDSDESRADRIVTIATKDTTALAYLKYEAQMQTPAQKGK